MLEARGNLWSFHAQGHNIAITTNGFVKSNGEAVMGRGVAQQARSVWPDIALRVGMAIKINGNIVNPFLSLRMFTFPVKHNWWEKADLDLIKRSAEQLNAYVDHWRINKIYIPRPGCGNGQLTWEQVKPVVEHLDNRFIFVTL